MSKKGKLYLIPADLGSVSFDAIFPLLNQKIILSLKHFIVEDLRSARRFLKKLSYPGNFDDVDFQILNEHTDPSETTDFLSAIDTGYDIGILSEAGMPCIADPGNIIVQAAHRRNIKIQSLIGPSSIFLALAASGLNGQNFAFLGYIPIKPNDRSSYLKEIEKKVWKNNQTQIFIEAPYRNMKLLDSILNSCNQDTMLCIASDLTLDTEFVSTKSIKEWKKIKTELHKRPTVFLLGKY